MKTYHGYRTMAPGIDGQPVSNGCRVRVTETGGATRDLPLRLDIRNHSPTGFEWGYGGSGPAQLSLALVADCCGDELAIAPIYQRVKVHVSKLPHDGWTLDELFIRQAVEDAKKEAGAFYPGPRDEEAT